MRDSHAVSMADLRRAGRYLGSAFRSILGAPDYEAYLQHMAEAHPEKVPLTLEAFMRNHREARFGRGRRTCCRGG